MPRVGVSLRLRLRQWSVCWIRGGRTLHSGLGPWQWSCAFPNLRWGNALRHKLEVGERRSFASHNPIKLLLLDSGHVLLFDCTLTLHPFDISTSFRDTPYHRVATWSCCGHVDELATEPFLLLHREHGTGYWRSSNCCDRRTCFVVIWKHFCFILSTGTKIRIDSCDAPSVFYSRGAQYKCLSYSYSYSVSWESKSPSKGRLWLRLTKTQTPRDADSDSTPVSIWFWANQGSTGMPYRPTSSPVGRPVI